jgi:hypothetical protein
MPPRFPQNVQSQAEMREFLPQGMSGSPLEKPCHSGGQGVEIAPDEQMDVIGLDSQLNELPAMLGGHFTKELLQPISYRSHQHLAASFRTPVHTRWSVLDHELSVLDTQGTDRACSSVGS